MMASYQQHDSSSQKQNQQSHQLGQSQHKTGNFHPLGATNSLISILQENQNSQETRNMTPIDSQRNTTEWEEKDDMKKSWEACKTHFKRCFIACKRCHDAKGTKVEEFNRIDADVTECWEAMKAQQAQEQKEAKEQLQQLTIHNTVLVELIQTQQKKIDELLKTSNKMMAALQFQTSESRKQATTTNTNKGLQVCKH